MWVKNLSKFPITLFKAEKIVVLNPGCIADVDLPSGFNMTRQGLKMLDLTSAKDIVAGQPAAIIPAEKPKRTATNKKRGARYDIRKKHS